MAQAAQQPAQTSGGPPAPVVVEFAGVSTRLGGRQILDGLSFEVRRGETFVIIGYSGTGKSVTLRHLVGLMRPDAGSIRVDGEEITTMSGRELEEMRKKFGVLFQSGALIAWLSVYENVELPLLEHRKLSRKARAQIIEEKLKLVNLWQDKDKYPAEISGGMKKRAGLARAIALDPEIVLYDEPSSGLDPVIANEIDKLINSLRDKLGMTSIVVTHDMDSAYFIANRIAMFYHGKMIQVGTPAQIRNTTLPEVRHFITGGKEGSLSLRSQAALETGRAPGLAHPSMRVESPSGETTIMQGYVLLDEVPPEGRTGGEETARGIPREETVLGELPVEDGETTRHGLAPQTVEGAAPVLSAGEDLAPAREAAAAARLEAAPVTTPSGRYVVDDLEPEETGEDGTYALPDKGPGPHDLAPELQPEDPDTDRR
ncbi:ABC transporter ATP-binding protein [bacterium]|nr:MAG: ABC transporter ATP-binding protein [bacterium]RIK65443.1 MAG: hypothetical protein DCC64_01130 [Planctomycetota bacterium]